MVSPVEPLGLATETKVHPDTAIRSIPSGSSQNTPTCQTDPYRLKERSE